MESETTTEPEITEVVVAATEPDAVTETTEAAPLATDPAGDDTLPAPVDSGPDEAPEDSPAGDASCLVGDWVIGEDQMNAYYDALEATLAVDGPAPDFDIAGNALLSFGESDYTYTGDFDLTIDVAGQTGTGQTAGTVTGTWQVVDGLVVTTLGRATSTWSSTSLA